MKQLLLIILFSTAIFGQSGKSVLTQAQKDSIQSYISDSLSTNSNNFAKGKQVITGNLNGDTRGNNATDFQFVRANDSLVASGESSFLFGSENQAGGNYSTAGGYGNLIYDNAKYNRTSTSATSLGYKNISNNAYSVSLGHNLVAEGENAVALTLYAFSASNDGLAAGNESVTGRRVYDVDSTGSDSDLGTSYNFIYIATSEGDVTGRFNSTQLDGGSDVRFDRYPYLWLWDGSGKYEEKLIINSSYTADGTKIYYQGTFDGTPLRVLATYSPQEDANGNADGNSATAFGRANNATGDASFVANFQNKVWANYSAGFGTNNRIYGGADASFISGSENVITGTTTFVTGRQNKDSSSYNIIGGRSNSNNTTSATYNIISGQGNTNTGDYNSINGNTITNTGDNNFIAGGTITNSGSYNIIGGQNQTITGSNSMVSGALNTASAQYNRVNGLRAEAHRYGQNSFASGQFNEVGDAQVSEFVVRRYIGSSTAELSLDGLTPNTLTNRLVLEDFTSYNVEALVVIRRTDSTSAAYKLNALVTRTDGAATTQLLGYTQTVIYEEDSTMNSTLTVDTNDGLLKVNCTGGSGNNRCVAYVKWVEVK